MQIGADRRRAEANTLRLPQDAPDKDLRHDNGLVLHGMVFANPELIETERFGPHGQLNVLFVALGQWFVRWMERHDENA